MFLNRVIQRDQPRLQMDLQGMMDCNNQILLLRYPVHNFCMHFGCTGLIIYSVVYSFQITGILK